MRDRVDDGTVADGELLWRRIVDDEDWIVRDETGKIIRVSSAAFIDRLSYEVSVHRSSMTTEAFVLRNHPTHGIAELRASVPRALRHLVVADPVVDEPEEDDDLSHAVLCPPADVRNEKLKKLARKMAQQSPLIREPRILEHAAPRVGEKPDDG